ncbi:unnamed protein product [Aphanomyces euteiches]|nr:hypothetical protein Ae201684_018892 [Aphanomyces euteiches]KAH9073970.1 hypothetical protein Ae201684P_015870 [Aphanomyces euteiches]
MPLKTTDGKISSWKCSALMYASRVGHIDLVRLLLAQDHIDVNAKQEKVFTVHKSIWAFLAKQREEMKEQATTSDSQVRQLSREMLLSMRRGAILHFDLKVPDGFIISDGSQSQTLHWQGEVASVRYILQCTSSAPLDQVMFQTKIIVGSNIMILKSFLFVTSEAQTQMRNTSELQSIIELIPQQYEEIPYQDLNLRELVGQGHFGDAFRAEYKGKDVVAKTLRAQTFGESSDDIVQEFRHEAAVLSMFGHHPNIVPFVGASTDLSQPLALVTAYCRMEA